MVTIVLPFLVVKEAAYLGHISFLFDLCAYTKEIVLPGCVLHIEMNALY